jgi:hypothetical protein
MKFGLFSPLSTFCWSVACLAAFAAIPANRADGAIKISNFTPGETIRYPVPMLQGTLDNASAKSIVVTNESSKGKSREITSLAEGGRFKALTELVPGENRLTLTSGNERASFVLNYKPQTNKHFIRAVLFTDNTGDTRYDSPVPNDPQNYKGKYDTIMKIMQSFTAEWMNHYGYGRKTFNLEFDKDGQVVVHIVKGKKPADWYKYDVANRGDLYGTVTREVGASLPDAPSVDCVLISFSSVDPKTGKSLAYTALGGGKIALFGGACVYAFPDSLADVQKAFMDATPVDGKKFVDDSAGRSTMWGVASTSIGAMMHEIGHSMGLPHVIDGRGIMRRGFDNFGRNFVFQDPPSKRNKAPVKFKESETGYWSPVSAAALIPSVWLRVDKQPEVANAESPTVMLSPDGKEFIITSPVGLGFVGYEIGGAAKDFIQIDQKAIPNKLTLPVSKLTPELKEKGQFRIIDANGKMTTNKFAELLTPFVKYWQFAPDAIEWTDTSKFPAVSDKDLATAWQKIAGRQLVKSRSPRINIESQYPKAPSQAVAYLGRKIVSKSPQKIFIVTGSDDGIRVWLNGQLVTESLDGRAAEPDAESNPATLKAGENQLLVEVNQNGGAWALYLRLEDESHHPLALKNDGTLTATVAAQ